MKIINIFLFVSIVLFSTGCNNKLDPVAKKQSYKTPQWYISPPNNDNRYLYGLGEGENMLNAQKSALENLSSRLAVKVSSELNLSNESFTDFREYIQKSVKHQLKSKTTELSIMNYKIIKSSQLSLNRYVILIQIDKSKLADHIKYNIETLYKNIIEEKRRLKNENILTRLAFYENSHIKIQTRLTKLHILKNIEPSYDIQRILKLSNRLQNTYNTLKNSASVSISTDKNSKVFLDTIQTFLVENGFKVSNKKYNNATHVNLHISSNTTTTNVEGLNIIKSSITTHVISDSKSKITGNIIHLKTASSHNKDKNYSLNKKLYSTLSGSGVYLLFGNKYKNIFNGL